MRNILFWAFAWPLLTVAQPVQPTEKPLECGKVLTLRSTVLAQERVLNVWLPDGYHDTTATYPVLYVLDGGMDEDFPHLAGLMQFMNMYGLYPPTIVVGVANNGRSRYHDFTGGTTNDSDKVWVPSYGGSATFIRYLAEEVMPAVQDRYRTNGHHALLGQSLGGLLAAEVLFTRPGLFDDYILVSPSLWWNNGALAATAGAWAKPHAGLPKRVYIAWAPDDEMMLPQIRQVADALDGMAAPFQFWQEPFPDESHLTILHRAAYKALELMGGR